MSNSHAQLQEERRPWHRVSLRSAFLVMLGTALIVPFAQSDPESVTLAIPFLSCSMIGAMRGRGRFRRMLLLGGIGGTVGLWIGGLLCWSWSHVHMDFSRVAAAAAWDLHDGLFVIILVLNSVAFFLFGAGVAAAIWCVQRIRAKVKSQAVSVGRLTVYAVLALLLVVNCLLYGFWLLSVLGW
jgi:hypothetical protein